MVSNDKPCYGDASLILPCCRELDNYDNILD